MHSVPIEVGFAPTDAQAATSQVQRLGANGGRLVLTRRRSLPVRHRACRLSRRNGSVPRCRGTDRKILSGDKMSMELATEDRTWDVRLHRSFEVRLEVKRGGAYDALINHSTTSTFGRPCDSHSHTIPTTPPKASIEHLPT